MAVTEVPVDVESLDQLNRRHRTSGKEYFALPYFAKTRETLAWGGDLRQGRSFENLVGYPTLFYSAVPQNSASPRLRRRQRPSIDPSLIYIAPSPIDLSLDAVFYRPPLIYCAQRLHTSHAESAPDVICNGLGTNAPSCASLIQACAWSKTGHKK